MMIPFWAAKIDFGKKSRKCVDFGQARSFTVQARDEGR
jgi:hypothetical protein